MFGIRHVIGLPLLTRSRLDGLGGARRNGLAIRGISVAPYYSTHHMHKHLAISERERHATEPTSVQIYITRCIA